MTRTQAGRFRWGIVGTGSVARQFAYGLSSVQDAGHVSFLAAQNPERTKQVADMIGAQAWSTDFTECLQSDVDGVYIAAPLGHHEALAIAALRAGKPTLIEKPMALDESSARRVLAVAGETGTFCMEAMWPRFLPVYRDLKQRIEQGELGVVRRFGATFSGAVKIDAGFGVFDGTQRGGALMHRSCYGVSMARYLLGPIVAVKAMGRVLDDGVDAHAALLLSHEGGATSSISASYETSNKDHVFVAGTQASVELSPSLYRPTKAYLKNVSTGRQTRVPGSREKLKAYAAWNRLRDRLEGLRSISSKGQRLKSELLGFGYGYQAAETVRCVAAGLTQSPLMPLDESAEIAGILDQAYTQIHDGAAV